MKKRAEVGIRKASDWKVKKFVREMKKKQRRNRNGPKKRLS